MLSLAIELSRYVLEQLEKCEPIHLPSPIHPSDLVRTIINILSTEIRRMMNEQREIRCPKCGSRKFVKNGKARRKNIPDVQLYKCKECGKNFNERHYHGEKYPEVQHLLAVLKFYEIGSINAVARNMGISRKTLLRWVNKAEECLFTCWSKWRIIMKKCRGKGKGKDGKDDGKDEDKPLTVQADETLLKVARSEEWLVGIWWRNEDDTGGLKCQRGCEKEELERRLECGQGRATGGFTGGFTGAFAMPMGGNTFLHLLTFLKRTMEHIKIKEVHTDSLAAYKDATGMLGVKHKAVNKSAGVRVDGDANTNGIESYWSVSKPFFRRMRAISPKRLRRAVTAYSFYWTVMRNSDNPVVAMTISLANGWENMRKEEREVVIRGGMDEIKKIGVEKVMRLARESVSDVCGFSGSQCPLTPIKDKGLGRPHKFTCPEYMAIATVGSVFGLSYREMEELSRLMGRHTNHSTFAKVLPRLPRPCLERAVEKMHDKIKHM